MVLQLGHWLCGEQADGCCHPTDEHACRVMLPSKFVLPRGQGRGACLTARSAVASAGEWPALARRGEEALRLLCSNPSLMQCNVLQPLYDFSGARRSCQRSLQRRRERRQRYRQLQQQQQQQAQRKQGVGAAAVGSGSSADDSEAAAAGTHSDCSQEPEGWLTHSEAAQDSITRQASANLPPQLPMTAIVLTVPAASAAAAPALPATDFRPAAADWQLAGWPHMMQPAEVPYSTHQAAPPPPQQGAHTPLPPPAQLPAKQLPAWTPEAEQQAGLVSAQPSFASMQRQPPQQWQQPGPHLLASSPLPPQEQLPLWLQQPGQVQFAHMARRGQWAQQLQLAPDGQWETVYSVPAPQHGQPMGAPVTVLHPEQLLAGAAQLQQQQVGMQQLQQAQQAQHAQQGQQAQPCMLVWQHSAPLAQLEQLEPHPALQHCSRAPSLPAAMGFAAPVHQQGLTHSHSCPSLLASLEVRTSLHAWFHWRGGCLSVGWPTVCVSPASPLCLHI